MPDRRWMKHARIEKGPGDHFSFSVEGEEFPYHIAKDDIEVTIDPRGPSTVRLTVFVERLEVDSNDSHEERPA